MAVRERRGGPRLKRRSVYGLAGVLLLAVSASAATALTLEPGTQNAVPSVANQVALAPGSIAPNPKLSQSPKKAAHARADDPWQACLSAADQVEQDEKLPEKMLAAVTTVETGWGQTGAAKTRYPWPWTVTAQGRGQHFPTKDAAITAVRRMLASGISSIDVGCMQINLFYHPRAFTGLEEAFEPAANLRYAVSFLRQLKSTHGSWESALEHYHSYDPTRRQDYRVKVFAAWQDAQARRDQLRQASGISDAPLGAETRVTASLDDEPLLGDRDSRAAQTEMIEFPASWQTPAPITTTSADMILPPEDDHAARTEKAKPGSGPRVVIPVDLSPRPSDRFSSELQTTDIRYQPAHRQVALVARSTLAGPSPRDSFAE